MFVKEGLKESAVALKIVQEIMLITLLPSGLEYV